MDKDFFSSFLTTPKSPWSWLLYSSTATPTNKKVPVTYLNPSTYNASPGYTITKPCISFNPLANVLYVVGFDADCTVYEVIGDQWSTCAPMNVLWRKLPACAMDSRSMNLFVFGGFFGVYLDSIEQYNVTADKWNVLSNVTLSERKNRFSCILFATYGNHIYCAGGWNGSEHFATIEMFDPITLTIDSTKYQLNGARKNVRLLVSNRCLLFMGGSFPYSNLIEYICAPTGGR